MKRIQTLSTVSQHLWRHIPWTLGLLLLLGLVGCPKKVVINRDLLCHRNNSKNCLTPDGFAKPSPTATAPLPLYDTNGAPVTCWRFVEEGKTVGILLTGESTHPFTSPLLHAFYYSMLPYSTPTDLLGAGYALIMNPGGAQTGPQYLGMLSNWMSVFKQLKAANWIQIRKIDAIKHKRRIQNIRKDIQRFVNSPHSRTILYYPDTSNGEPLLLPVFALKSEPRVAQAKFSVTLMPPVRARALGEIYYLQQYESSRPFWKALWPIYNKNIKLAKDINEVHFKCSHSWNKLFHVKRNKMGRSRFQLFRELKHTDNPSLRRREYCTAQNLKMFRASRAIQKQVNRYRKRLDLLNDTFHDLLKAYNKAYNSVKTLKDLSMSTFLDSFLRGEVLFFTAPIRVRKQIRYPQSLMRDWMRDSRTRIWRQLMKDFQSQGQHLQSSAGVGGILHRPYTFFRIRRNGTDYLVRPYTLVGGPFAIVLDRTRGVIEVLTPHHTASTNDNEENNKNKSSHQTPDFVKSKAKTKTPASKKPNVRARARRFKKAPLLQAPGSFYQPVESPKALLAMSRQAWTRQSKRRKIRQHHLYPLIQRRCLPNTPITPIRHIKVRNLPHPIPKIPTRSFLLQQSFFWMRYQCNLLVIPAKGNINIPTHQQKPLARKIEQTILKHDAIPSLITINSLQPLHVKISF